ncbi:6585_t:CDS:2, partial [Racocetra persica]
FLIIEHLSTSQLQIRDGEINFTNSTKSGETISPLSFILPAPLKIIIIIHL